VRLGLIGCGSIGSTVIRTIAAGQLPGVQLIGVAALTRRNEALRTTHTQPCPLVADVPALLALKPDLVLEAASADAVRSFATDVFDCGADLMVVSVGALADAEFLACLIEQARRTGRRIYVPSGAIGGVDIIKAAAWGGLEECRLTTTKSPASLKGAPYLHEHGIDLEAIRQATVIFEGSAAQAVRCFPRNVNVAATISLAGLGLDKTTVCIIADPAATRNVHEIFLRGNFGEATIRLVNQAHPENPRSSYLASLSVITTLQCVSQQFQIGT